MNREIKFRAWDTLNQEMLKPYDVNGNFKDLEWFFSQYHELESSGNNLILMQYTGLKDRNGKEIYEGDVIQTKLGSKDLVKYGNGTFYWRDEPLYYDHGEICPTEKWAEVIGNIYENPNLINP